MEELTLDPAEVIPERVELSLHELGLEVREEGADWGDGQVDAELVRQEIGATVSDLHLPPVEMTIPLRVREEGGTSLAQALQPIEQKVGRWQEPGSGGGWIKREFSEEGGFAGAVAYKTLFGTLSPPQGWLLAHRQVDPERILKVTRSPLCYALVEVTSSVFEETEERELILELASILGTAPGHIRLRVTNNSESQDWRGLVFAAESRDHPGEATKDTTAALAYAAADLTPKGGSEVKEVEGEKVIEHASLTAGWLTILNSEHLTHGHLTHAGIRRLWLRAEDLGEEAGDVELRLRYRSLGSLAWTTNRIVPSPLVDDWQWLDMGECRLDAAVLGDERWEFEVQARAPGGSGNVRLHRVAPLPTEQYVVAVAPDVSQSADEQEQKSPGTVVSKEAALSGELAWANPSNAQASDASRATVALGPGELSEYLWATNLGFEIPEGATITDVVVEGEVSKSGGAEIRGQAILIVGGAVHSVAKESLGGSPWTMSDQYLGSSLGSSVTFSDVNAEDFGAGIYAESFGPETTALVNHIRVTVYFTEAVDPNRVCFAGRSIELRSDGIYRQGPGEDDVWGKTPAPGGSYPTAPPSGLEERPYRAILIPTQGDLDTIADSGGNPLSAQVFTRPGYSYAREAAGG